MSVNEPLVFAVAVFVQLIGFLSVALARVSERSAAQALCQTFFIGCLLAVGGIGMLAVHTGIGCWFICATTLPLMAVGVTSDPNRARKCSVI
ncbi:MAG: hypothetical protein ACC628_12035 [Pirellulaceae bacterium]